MTGRGPRVLLLGGGHTQLVAGPLLARLAGGSARLEMLAPAPRLLYSGMMPGWLAGRWDFDACALPLARIAGRAGLRWIGGVAVDIDFRERRVRTADGTWHPYDLIALNVGSENTLGDTPAGTEGVLGAKPFATFVERWRLPPRDSEAVVVGAGPAGVEIAFALVACRLRVTLATLGDDVLEGLAPAARRLARRRLAELGVRLCTGWRFEGAGDGQARFVDRDGARHLLAARCTLVASGARTPAWLAAAARRDGVAVAEDGAVVVDDALQSVSHPGVFASGDCAMRAAGAIPRSGVHALRQGPTLARSLAAAIAGRTPAADWRPPRRTLALLDTGDGRAIGAWGPFAFEGRWVQRWKTRIDRGFVARFAESTVTASDRSL